MALSHSGPWPGPRGNVASSDRCLRGMLGDLYADSQNAVQRHLEPAAPGDLPTARRLPEPVRLERDVSVGQEAMARELWGEILGKSAQGTRRARAPLTAFVFPRVPPCLPCSLQEDQKEGGGCVATSGPGTLPQRWTHVPPSAAGPSSTSGDGRTAGSRGGRGLISFRHKSEGGRCVSEAEGRFDLRRMICSWHSW